MFNLYWLSVKQFRLGQRLNFWLHEKVFDIGLQLHIFRKYHKLNPSVPEIAAVQHGGKLYPYLVESFQAQGYHVPEKLKSYKKELLTDSAVSLQDRIGTLKVMVADINSGMLDYDEALKEEIAGRILIGTQAIIKEISEGK